VGRVGAEWGFLRGAARAPRRVRWPVGVAWAAIPVDAPSRGNRAGWQWTAGDLIDLLFARRPGAAIGRAPGAGLPGFVCPARPGRP